MKVSVIVPIYGVEKFIRRCAESLMSQTLGDVEYIFVNDATKDRSIEILTEVIDKYPERKDRIKIVTHEKNQGLPAARNRGLSLAQGDYIFHCDSDDFIENNMLELMYGCAVTNNADIVWSDWFLSYENSERYMKQPSCSSPQEALNAILKGVMKYNVWNKLVKRSLYMDNSISFPAGYGMGEDMTMIMLFCNAERVAYCPHAFYHYVKLNENAFSNTYSQKHLTELQYNVDRICTYLSKHYGNAIEENLNFFKLEVKFPFLISDRKEKYELWKTWYPESDKYAFKNKSISFRRRLLQTMAAHNQWWFVRTYYFLLYQISALR